MAQQNQKRGMTNKGSASRSDLTPQTNVPGADGLPKEDRDRGPGVEGGQSGNVGNSEKQTNKQI